MTKSHILLLILFAALSLSCKQREERLYTDRTSGLVGELLVKLDSADVYAARKEAVIEASKQRLDAASTCRERCLNLYDVANLYAHYALDSAIVYIEKAVHVAGEIGDGYWRIMAEIRRSTLLTIGGFYMAAAEILDSIPAKSLSEKQQVVAYYNAWMLLYHEAYTSPNEPSEFKNEYKVRYEAYRDSLINVADTMSIHYLRNMEKRELHAGNFGQARKYNAIRMANTPDQKSEAYATCLYDRFMIAYRYEDALSGEDVDDLLQAAIIELECCNRDINSMLIVVSLLDDVGDVKNAKKISDYYYDSLLKFGSRKRLLECGLESMAVNEHNLVLLRRKNMVIVIVTMLVSLMAIALLLSTIKINNSRRKIVGLKNNLHKSNQISKGYLGAVFKLYSSYIKRLEAFRTKIYSTLKKGNVEQTLELASPSKDLVSEERRNLFHHFDTAFVDIFPDFIDTVNSYLKPDMRITPKRTEVLNNELRILALMKLGIDDNEEIAEMLHCTVKTVMNLRAIFRSRLAVSEERFKRAVWDL